MSSWRWASARRHRPQQLRPRSRAAPCGDSNDFACGHLTVPLDPSGGTPGTITLAIRRHRAPVGEAKDAIVALAGGPGQSAIPFTEQFARVLGPIADTRDLIVFDQRGIGLSGPLSCHRFELDANTPPGPTIAECAAQLGPTRSFYATADTVADIEALRVAGGYEKLVLYGTSYGTKVAEDYAQEYPSHVEALVLDSVVPPNGPEPLNRATLAAVPRILRQLCAARACVRITPNPVGDLARLVRRLARGGLRGRVIDGHGIAHTVRISSDGLLGTLIEGDLEPILRSEFPAAVRSAVNGDTAPLARLEAHAESVEASEAEEPQRELRQPALLRDELRRRAVPVEPRGQPGDSPGRSEGPNRRVARKPARAVYCRRTCSTSATCRHVPSGPTPRPRPRPMKRHCRASRR